MRTPSKLTDDHLSSVIDYRINKRIDTYLAYTNNHFSGDKYPRKNWYQNINTLGAGVHFKC